MHGGAALRDRCAGGAEPRAGGAARQGHGRRARNRSVGGEAGRACAAWGGDGRGGRCRALERAAPAARAAASLQSAPVQLRRPTIMSATVAKWHFAW